MEYVFPITAALFLVGTIAFEFGKYTKQYPTDEEMMERLIAGRVEQRLVAGTKIDLEREINEAADKRA